eukprot:TRINITY_DN1703_c1_g1_i5.p2 TRINITY_DN1703_c1_g1~~TRINITY_DN1703_c1_g1_i5.p2  ORF type:complete len:274 (-),score=-17.04 TRINITY_DN1703_c1_g1_i5:1705-2526(-)
MQNVSFVTRDELVSVNTSKNANIFCQSTIKLKYLLLLFIAIPILFVTTNRAKRITNISKIKRKRHGNLLLQSFKCIKDAINAHRNRRLDYDMLTSVLNPRGRPIDTFPWFRHLRTYMYKGMQIQPQQYKLWDIALYGYKMNKWQIQESPKYHSQITFVISLIFLNKTNHEKKHLSSPVTIHSKPTCGNWLYKYKYKQLVVFINMRTYLQSLHDSNKYNIIIIILQLIQVRIYSFTQNTMQRILPDIWQTKMWAFFNIELNFYNFYKAYKAIMI